jgi:predicted chitinase
MATLPLTHQEIALALECHLEDVGTNWPRIESCLDSLGGGSMNSKIAALATIAVETANTFRPIHEYGTDALHEKLYGLRADLGNTHAGDGAKFAGRGFIQVTGEFNYARYGQQLGIDLVANPENACNTDVAAAIFAAFWRERKCSEAADEGQWAIVRKRVNGGKNGLFAFLHYISQLQAAIAEKIAQPANVCTEVRP